MEHDDICRKRALLKKQLKEAMATNGVTCECGHHIKHLAYAYRCRWCGLFFCRQCAGKHFGKDEEYEKRAAELGVLRVEAS